MINDKKSESRKKSGSFVLRALNSFTLWLYSIFAGSAIVRKLSVSERLYETSTVATYIEKKSSKMRNRSPKYAGSLFDQSYSLNAVSRLRAFLSSIAVNVYGMFFVVYAISSIFMYYIAVVLNGRYENGRSAIIVPIVILICAIPMLFSSESVSKAVLGSRTISKILISFFSIPEEKLKPSKTISGSEYMFMSAIIGILLGIMTYFLHPAYLPVAFGILVLISLIASNSETGVIMTIAATPFLQYSDYANEILLALVVVSALSYISKVIRRHRIVSLSSESIYVLLFCFFLIASGIHSNGGSETIKETISAIVLIMGGFFLTYNLIKGKSRLEVCTKILLVSYAVICLFGIWNVFYNAIVEHNIYSIREEVSPIFENNVIFIADDFSVFSALSVLLTPLLVGKIARAKSFKGRAFAIVLTTMSIITTCIYGTFEALVAIVLEIIVFSLLYSHKSLTAILLISVPLIVLVVLYPYIERLLNLPDIWHAIRGILPLNDQSAAYRGSLFKSVLTMIADGNWSGIGVGETAFKSTFQHYSNSVTEGLSSPGSLWLQVVCWGGAGGLVCFVLSVITVAWKGLGYSVNLKKSPVRDNLIALVSGFIALLFFGGVSSIWIDNRVMYLFWVYAGLIAAYVREFRDEDNRRDSALHDSFSMKDIEIRN